MIRLIANRDNCHGCIPSSLITTRRSPWVHFLALGLVIMSLGGAKRVFLSSLLEKNWPRHWQRERESGSLSLLTITSALHVASMHDRAGKNTSSRFYRLPLKRTNPPVMPEGEVNARAFACSRADSPSSPRGRGRQLRRGAFSTQTRRKVGCNASP